MRSKIFPMFLFRENYNLLEIERLNGNNNSEWCSTTLENQNKQQWHVWFVKNHDDEILILENKLLMKNVLFDGQQGDKFAPGSAGLFLYLLVSQIFTLLLQFSFHLVVRRRVVQLKSIFGSSFAKYFGNKKLLDISRGLHKKRITHMIQFTRDFSPIIDGMGWLLLWTNTTVNDFTAGIFILPRKGIVLTMFNHFL